MPEFDWLDPIVASELGSLEKDLATLRGVFDCLPSSFPDHEKWDNEHGLLALDFENPDGPEQEAPLLSIYLERCFGPMDDIVIPEHCPRLIELLEQLWVSAEIIGEDSGSVGSAVEGIRLIHQWVTALIHAAGHAHDPAPEPLSPSPLLPDLPSEVSPPGSPAPISTRPIRRAPVDAPEKTKQLKLTAFKRLTRAEMEELERASAEERRARRERAARLAEEYKQRKLQQVRDNARRRQSERRQRQVEQDIADGKRTADGKLVTLTVNEALTDGNKTHFTDPNAAARITLSRQYTHKTVKRHKTNWAHPAVFAHLDGAAKVVGFLSPTAIVKRVKMKDDSGMFTHLRADVLCRYIDEDEHGNSGWTPAFLERVKREHAKAGPARSKLIDKYPDVFGPALRQIQMLRVANNSISLSVGRSIILAHVRRAQIPELANFKATDSWMRAMFSRHLSWSYRTTTRASAKLPVDWPAQCSRSQARGVYSVKMNGVDHPDFLVNVDQAGLGLIPTGKKTWTEKGAKQVKGHAHDEKRQTTLVVASTASGIMLPFHTIWGGSTDKSLPALNAPRRHEADALGFKYAHGDTRHWSSRETTKMWVRTTLYDHYVAMCNKHNKVVGRQKLLLFLDCWPVHIANKNREDFLPWMRREYPYFLLNFIPAGCTGVFQPADVGLQRLIKHIIRTSALDWFVGFTMRGLIAGTPPEKIELPTSLPVLRDASISWTLDAFAYFQQRPDLVKSAWARCAVGDLNLSWESLTSEAALQNYQSLIADDPAFRAEFSRLDPIVPARNGAAEPGNDGSDDDSEYEDDTALSADQLSNALIAIPAVVARGRAEICSPLSDASVLESADFADKQPLPAVDCDSDSDAPAVETPIPSPFTNLCEQEKLDYRPRPVDINLPESLYGSEATALFDLGRTLMLMDTSGIEGYSLDESLQFPVADAAAAAVGMSSSCDDAARPRAPVPPAPPLASFLATDIAVLGGTNLAFTKPFASPPAPRPTKAKKNAAPTPAATRDSPTEVCNTPTVSAAPIAGTGVQSRSSTKRKRDDGPAHVQRTLPPRKARPRHAMRVPDSSEEDEDY